MWQSKADTEQTYRSGHYAFLQTFAQVSNRYLEDGGDYTLWLKESIFELLNSLLGRGLILL